MEQEVKYFLEGICTFHWNADFYKFCVDESGHEVTIMPTAQSACTVWQTQNKCNILYINSPNPYFVHKLSVIAVLILMKIN